MSFSGGCKGPNSRRLGSRGRARSFSSVLVAAAAHLPPNAELTALFEVCDASTPGGARNAGLLSLLYGGGLRRAEVVALDLGDYEIKTGRLVVKGKGNKGRVVWATNGSRDALDAWLAIRGQEPGPLFLPATKGSVIERRRMSDQAVAELVRWLARRAKIARFSPP